MLNGLIGQYYQAVMNIERNNKCCATLYMHYKALDCTILSLACYNSGQKGESIWSLIVLTRDNLALDNVAQH